MRDNSTLMPKRPERPRRAPKTVTLPKPDAAGLADTMEPLSRRPWRSALRWSITLALLGTAAWWLRAPAQRLLEARHWKRLASEDFHSATSVDVRWDGRPYHFVSEGGPLRLQM